MTVHPLPSNVRSGHPSPQAHPDSASPYDSTWTEQPAHSSQDGLDQVMGQSGKIYVVLAVVLVIWFGILTFLIRTDRKIDRLERRLDRDIPDHE